MTFDNFISRVAFSQQFFDPSLGQTQEVTATFAANANWTLQITDEDSNVVRTVTGSGATMTFDWDGTGDGGTNLSNGVYYYTVSAQTNGLPLVIQPPGGGGSGGGPSSPAFASAAAVSAEELFAMPSDGSGSPVPLVLYPPGFDTNSLTIFEASWSEILSLTTLRRGTLATTDSGNAGGVTSDAAGASNSGSQSTTAPARPPTVPARGPNGMYGVAYYDFPTRISVPAPFNGLPGFPRPMLQEIQGSTGNFTVTNIPLAAACANRFAARMQRGAWKEGFKLSEAGISLNDLRSTGLGGDDKFSTVTVGLLETHGAYGTKPDYHSDAGNGHLDTYLVGDNPADFSSPWIRTSELGFGGSLRYMAILACNILCDPNYNDMQNNNLLPIPSNLHLLCSCSSTAILTENIGELWADNMLTRTGIIHRNQKFTVVNAWFQAGSDSYSQLGPQFFLFAVHFRVAGWSSAINDTIKDATNSTSGSITPSTQQVH